MNYKNRIGTYTVHKIAGETYRTYTPKDLPPNPPLKLDDKILSLLDEANLNLGRLDGMSMQLPSIDLIVYMYIRKEALLSSQIEGTQSSFTDLMLYENKETPGVPIDDVREVINYINAINYGLKRVESDLPLSLRLLKEIHAILLNKGRGQYKSPGEFRKTQNWIGGTRPGNALFIPPVPEDVMACMGALEKFLHNDPAPTPTLIKAALAHVQFETIHPFLDGNGRLGRLLITLLLCVEKILCSPILYLSLYLKTNRQTYYELLQEVREQGNWEAWLEFFLQGIISTSSHAIRTIKQIVELFDKHLGDINKLSRKAGSTFALYQYMQKKPITSVSVASDQINYSIPTTEKAMQNLINLEIVKEVTRQKRNRLFIYQKYVDILSQNIESI